MKYLASLVALWAALFVPVRAQVVLQNFSNVADGVNTFFYGTWEATGDTGGSVSPNAHFSQGVGVYDFAGSTSIVPTNAATSFVEFFYTTPQDIGSNGFISVSAQALAGNTASSFTVFLLDTLGNSAYASFSTASFLTGSYSTTAASYTTIGAFNPSSIDSMRISGNQPGGSSTFAVSFNEISAAVPEPSSYVTTLGFLALGIALVARHRCRTSF